MATAKVWGVVIVDSDGRWNMGGSSENEPENVVHNWSLADDLGLYARQYLVRTVVEVPPPAPIERVAEAISWLDFGPGTEANALRDVAQLSDDELSAAIERLATLRGIG